MPSAPVPSGRESFRSGSSATEPGRLDRLRQVKLQALVTARWGARPADPAGDDEGQSRARVAGLFVAGATLSEAETGRGWVLDESGGASVLGPALIWAARQGMRELHVLVDGAGAGPAAGVLARRAALFVDPPQVWTVSGRDLAPAVAGPLPAPIEPPAAARTWIPRLRDHGLDVVVEHGVVIGQVRGLEVARVVADSDPDSGPGPDSHDGAVVPASPAAGVGWHVEVGVGHHDREARAEMHPGESVAESLDQVVALVRRLRVAGATRHPASTLAREGWLRWVVMAHPELVGAVRLGPVAPPVARADLRLPAPAAAAGVAEDGAPVVVVCSVGVDPDLVPTAADTRELLGLAHAVAGALDDTPGGPPARLVLAVPAGDDYPVTRDLAERLRAPAEVVVLPRNWATLA